MVKNSGSFKKGHKTWNKGLKMSSYTVRYRDYHGRFLPAHLASNIDFEKREIERKGNTLAFIAFGIYCLIMALYFVGKL